MQMLNAWLAQSLSEHLQINAMILFNIIGALLLGMIIGYERSYHGRAAGMRTYGMVCMGSSALTVIIGYPLNWYGGMPGILEHLDVTRVIQGIVTGVGFLGAGVILKEGRNISGLTTAASIWASSAIGIMFGGGFYFVATMLSLVVAATMIWGSHLESVLPSRQTLEIVLRFQDHHLVDHDEITQRFAQFGYLIVEGSMVISNESLHQEWMLILVANQKHAVSVASIANGLSEWEFLSGYKVALTRN
jgi:putative Mg2+ transporter-C (MgtC) family protein